MTLEEIIARIGELVPDAACHEDKGHAVALLPVEKLDDACRILKTDDQLNFDFLMDLTAVDWQDRVPRFDVVYHLYSTIQTHRLRIIVKVGEGQSVPSITGLWKIADWFEREVWDLYGIRFSGHPNLTRLLLYEEFKGHPLRKDYPYDQQQPIVEQTWPSRETQVKVDDRGIHRP